MIQKKIRVAFCSHTDYNAFIIFGRIAMQLTVRMPDEYESLLDRLAKEMALKRSDIVRMALKHFFEEHQESPVQTPFQKVRHLLGVAESGIKDLGKNHRAYLINKIRKSS
jgi:hypothetical protein